jgi:hypothetical protein
MKGFLKADTVTDSKKKLQQYKEISEKLSTSAAFGNRYMWLLYYSSDFWKLFHDLNKWLSVKLAEVMN